MLYSFSGSACANLVANALEHVQVGWVSRIDIALDVADILFELDIHQKA